MTKYHKLYVPLALWDAIQNEASRIPGMKASTHAISKLQSPLMAYDPPKPSVAPREEINNNIIKKPKTTRVLFYNLEEDTYDWVEKGKEKDNNGNDLYTWFFLFCQGRSTLDQYAPIFKKDADYEITQDMIDLAKCLALEQDKRLKDVNKSRNCGTSQMNGNPEAEAQAKRNRALLFPEEGGGQSDDTNRETEGDV